jgi:hypothetical protein
MALAGSSWLAFWEFVEISGAVIVTVGVVGEYIADFTKLLKGNARKTRLRKISTLTLIAGLAIELVGLTTTSHAFNLEVAKANDDAKRAGTNAAASYERAAVAEKEAGQANERAANTESNNLMLQARVLELETKTQIRRITAWQMDEFIKLTKDARKFPVKVFIGRRDTETQNYSLQVRELLDKAGFGMEESGNLRDLGDAYLTMPIHKINDTAIDRPFIFVLFGEPSKPINWPGLRMSFDNEEADYEFDESKDLSGFGKIAYSFRKIGIDSTVVAKTNWFVTKPGEWGIFIHQKF